MMFLEVAKRPSMCTRFSNCFECGNTTLHFSHTSQCEQRHLCTQNIKIYLNTEAAWWVKNPEWGLQERCHYCLRAIFLSQSSSVSYMLQVLDQVFNTVKALTQYRTRLCDQTEKILVLKSWHPARSHFLLANCIAFSWRVIL